MSVPFKDCKVLQEQAGTVGGTTYMVKLPGKVDASPVCFRRMHGNPTERCVNKAGYGTNHVGTGACKFHGGNNPERPSQLTSGRYAVITKLRLDSQIQEYLQKDRSELLDLTYQLAATKAIFDEFMTEFPDPTSEDYGTWLFRWNSIVNTLSSLVEKITRVDSRNTLTNAQILYVRATLVDILMKYITDPADRDRVLKDLAARMGGDIEVNLQPSEIRLPKPKQLGSGDDYASID